MKAKVPGKCDGCSSDLPELRNKNVRFCEVCRPPFQPKPPKSIDAIGRHVCEQCHVLLVEKHRLQRFCEDCKKQRRNEKANRYHKESGHAPAYAVMRLAIKLGLLAHPKNFSCKDCGLPATCYDHRDYNKPLDVDPVCTSCNIQRGPGIPFVAIDDTFMKASDDQRDAMELLMRNAYFEATYGHGILHTEIHYERAIRHGLIGRGKEAA